MKYTQISWLFDFHVANHGPIFPKQVQDLGFEWWFFGSNTWLLWLMRLALDQLCAESEKRYIESPKKVTLVLTNTSMGKPY